MYPLKLLCKQYTNQSLSEILWEGISPFLPPVPCATRRLSPGQGLQGNLSGRCQRRAGSLRWSQVPMPSSWGLAEGRLSGDRSRLGFRRPPTSFGAGLFFFFSFPFHPGGRLHSPHPLPVPPPHPAHQAIPWQKQITKSPIPGLLICLQGRPSSHKIKMGEGPREKRLQNVLKDSVQPCRWLTLDPQQSISRPAWPLSSSASRLWRSGQPHLPGHARSYWGTRTPACCWCQVQSREAGILAAGTSACSVETCARAASGSFGLSCECG